MSHALFNSADCEFLQRFFAYGTISEFSKKEGIDKAQVSRKLSAIESVYPVISKLDRKWVLTEKGSALLNWHAKAQAEQRMILDLPSRPEAVVISTTQLIAESNVIPRLARLKRKMNLSTISIRTGSINLERELFNQSIHFAISCQVPVSPEIRYKRIFKSDYGIAVPATWKSQLDLVSLAKTKPFIRHSSIEIRSVLNADLHIQHPAYSFDLLASVRSAVEKGLGWSLLPRYCVSDGEHSAKLRWLPLACSPARLEEFNLWWIPKQVSSVHIQTMTQLFSTAGKDKVKFHSSQDP